MFKETTVTALDLAARLPDLLRAANGDSLVEFTRVTRVEPNVLTDQRAIHLDYIGDIMQCATSIFSGYYLQAVALSVNVGRIDVVKMLDKLNPGRSPIDNAGSALGNFLSAESYAHALPYLGRAISLEAAVSEDSTSNNGFGKDTISKTLSEVSNISVGKMLEVHVSSDGNEATIPVSVRMIVSAIDSKGLVHTLATGSKDTTVKERFHAWRSGQLDFIRDLVLCQDLIDEHRSTLMGDKSGVYASTLARRNKNRLSSIISGNPSVATASNIIVMTSQTAQELERELGGKLKDFRVREKMFANTYGMILFVIDTEWEQVTIYHRSIDQGTLVPVKQLKSINKGSGPDVGEILKAYQLGNAPSF